MTAAMHLGMFFTSFWHYSAVTAAHSCWTNSNEMQYFWAFGSPFWVDDWWRWFSTVFFNWIYIWWLAKQRNGKCSGSPCGLSLTLPCGKNLKVNGHCQEMWLVQQGLFKTEFLKLVWTHTGHRWSPSLPKGSWSPSYYLLKITRTCILYILYIYSGALQKYSQPFNFSTLIFSFTLQPQA